MGCMVLPRKYHRGYFWGIGAEIAVDTGGGAGDGAGRPQAEGGA